MSLDDLVNVTISKETATVSQVGFGTPMIMSNEADGVFDDGERARIYVGTAGMITDGFSATGATVAAATRFFAQQPKVRQIVVGRRTNLITQTIICTPIPLDLTVYTVEINGTAFTFTSDSDATADEISAGLVTAIELGAEPITAADLTGTFSLTADVAGEVFTLAVSRSQITQDDTTVEAGIVADLTAIRTDLTGNDDWYVVVTDSHATLETLALALHIETLQKFFCAASADDDILTSATDDLASDLQAADYARTTLMHHKDPHTFPEAAWAGSLLPLDPGSATWKFKSLTGVAFSTYTPTEKGHLKAKNCNYYIRDAGNNYTTEGYTSSGEFNDITRGVDWTVQRLRENAFLAFINAIKLGYTDDGIGVITNEIWGVLRQGISNNLFAEDPVPTVTAPDAVDVSAADRAARLLSGVEFTARFAGAIHAVDMAGRLTV